MLTLEKQVVSLELAKKMEELGFPQQNLFRWCVPKSGNIPTGQIQNWDSTTDKRFFNYFSAYTVGELGEFLKKENCSSGYSEEDVGWWCQSSLHDIYDVKEIDTEANARAKLAIYLAEKGLLDTKTLG